jgi:hypothetical protein
MLVAQTEDAARFPSFVDLVLSFLGSKVFNWIFTVVQPTPDIQTFIIHLNPRKTWQVAGQFESFFRDCRKAAILCWLA